MTAIASRICRIRRLAICLLAACLLLPAAASAEVGVDHAKAQGWIGERIDGYLGVVDPDAPAEVKSLVERVNAERRKKYAEIARKTGASGEAVAARAGAKLVERTPRGQYYLGGDGRWHQR